MRSITVFFEDEEFKSLKKNKKKIKKNWHDFIMQLVEEGDKND